MTTKHFQRGRTTVIYEPKSPSAHVSMWVDAGTRHARINQPGLPHLFEHLFLFQKKPGNILNTQEHWASKGFLSGGYTHKDVCMYWMCCLPGNEILASELLFSELQSFSLAQSDIQKEKGIFLREQFLHQGSHSTRCFQLADQGIWPSSGYALNPYGTPDQINGISLSDLEVFYRDKYHLEQVRIIIITPDKTRFNLLKQEIEDTNEDIPSFEKNSYSLPAVSQDYPAGIEGDSVDACFSYRISTVNSEKIAALHILRHSLNAGGAFNLNTEIRSKRGLAYNVNCSVREYIDTACLRIHTVTKVEHLSEIDKIIRTNVSDCVSRLASAPNDQAILNWDHWQTYQRIQFSGFQFLPTFYARQVLREQSSLTYADDLLNPQSLQSSMFAEIGNEFHSPGNVSVIHMKRT